MNPKEFCTVEIMVLRESSAIFALYCHSFYWHISLKNSRNPYNVRYKIVSRPGEFHYFPGFRLHQHLTVFGIFSGTKCPLI